MANLNSPFFQRIMAFSKAMPPPLGHPIHEYYEKITKYDLRLRREFKEFKKIQRSFVYTRMTGGSGFFVGRTLRNFFMEYYSRFSEYGPTSFPTSFNVMESFFNFSKQFIAFDLRPEREHLLHFSDYLDWYTSASFPEEPPALIDIMKEGIVYSYNMTNPSADIFLNTPNSALCVVGTGMVRHKNELSVVIIAGENPPFPADFEIDTGLDLQKISPGKEGLRPCNSLNIQSRYIEGLQEYSQVIMMARFDLLRSKYDVRYVNLDIGKSFIVFTDDPSIFSPQLML